MIELFMFVIWCYINNLNWILHYVIAQFAPYLYFRILTWEELKNIS